MKSRLMKHKRVVGVAYIFSLVMILCFMPKVYAAKSCIRDKDGTYYGKEGNVLTDKKKFYEECDYCEINASGYHDREGKVVTKEEYNKVCTCKNDGKTTKMDAYLENTYFKMDSAGANKYKISLVSNSLSEYKNVSFKVTKINGSTSGTGVGSIVSYNNPITLTITDKAGSGSAGDGDAESASDDYGLPGISVTLEAEYVLDKRGTNNCYYDRVEVTLAFTATPTDTATAKNCPEVTIIDAKKYLKKDGYDCSAYTDKTSMFITSKDKDFDYNFCNAKIRAQDGGKGDYTDKIACNTQTGVCPSTSTTVTGEGGETYRSFSDSYSIPTFKCNSNLETLPKKLESLEGDDYFVSRDYLYAKTDTVITGKHYEYEYTPGNFTESEEFPSCTVTCEEAVEVAYGPPVAARAGQCFEYNVRVTSYVTCNMTEASEFKAMTDCSYCTPYPSCYGAGKVWVQGGPNEDFDACIKSCDGGKYTEKCSNKCYQKVYGSSNVQANAQLSDTSLYGMTASLLTSLSECKNMPENKAYGCYYLSGGTIAWYPAKGNVFIPANSSNIAAKGKGVEGRWYTENGKGTASYSNNGYVFHSGAYGLPTWAEGFWRKLYNSGYCNDKCWWNMCSGSKYINPGFAEKDNKENADKYNATITKCIKEIDCRTTTSNYTISLDIKNDDKPAYVFPESGKDTITPKAATVSSTVTNKDTTLLPDFTKEDEGLLGCYDKRTPTNTYRTTWGFPYAYRHKKTGEYSLTSEGKSDSWVKIDGKICLPDSADKVVTNPTWFDAYWQKYLDDYGLTEGDVSSGTCKYKYFEGKITTSVTDWNIHASTKGFGYFGWNINIDCFYAYSKTSTSPPSLTPPTTICEPEGDDVEPEIRTIDLENFFPGKEGSASETREPGFNWSKYAAIDDAHNTNLVSNPINYVEATQNLVKSNPDGYYDNSRLDYEFTLTRETLLKIRQLAKVGSSYADFDVNNISIDKKTGLTRYKSDLIRGATSPIHTNNKKIPDAGLLYCNNLINWNARTCDDIHREGSFS